MIAPPAGKARRRARRIWRASRFMALSIASNPTCFFSRKPSNSSAVRLPSNSARFNRLGVMPAFLMSFAKSSRFPRPLGTVSPRLIRSRRSFATAARSAASAALAVCSAIFFSADAIRLLCCSTPEAFKSRIPPQAVSSSFAFSSWTPRKSSGVRKGIRAQSAAIILSRSSGPTRLPRRARRSSIAIQNARRSRTETSASTDPRLAICSLCILPATRRVCIRLA
jgi:hypothetical protein